MAKTIFSLLIVTSLLFGFGAIETSKATTQQPKTPQPPDFKHDKVLSKKMCSLGNNEFEMILTSPTGDTLEEDTTLWIVHAGSVSPKFIKSGDIALLPVNSKSKSICKAAAVFEVGGEKIAIPISVSNRPDLDTLGVVIYDPDLQKVLKYSLTKQYFGQLPKITEMKGGFSFLGIRTWVDDSPKGMVETWMNITWDGRNIVKTWDKSRRQVRHRD